jgi:hypothetical protein
LFSDIAVTGGHVSVVFLFVITRFINLIAIGKGGRLVRHDGGGRQNRRAAVQRSIDGSCINKWLEYRPRGTFCDRVIQLAEGVVASAHQGQDLAGVRIHRDQCYLWLWAGCDLSLVFAFADLYALGPALGYLIVHQLDSRLNRLCRRALKVGIKSGVNAICLLVHFTLI